MKKLVIIILSVFVFNSILAQTNGSVEVIKDERIDILVEKHIKLNEKQEGIPGYRVQIFFDAGNNSKNNANKIKAEFLLKTKGIEAHVLFQTPYYKVRVGDFRTKLEAFGYLDKIKEIYPAAYVVHDKIEFPEL